MFLRKQTENLTYLGGASVVQGDLKTPGNLRVDGVVLGTVEAGGDLEVAASGRIEGAQVKARNALIHGTVKSKVIIKGKLTLTRAARLEGDAMFSSLDVAEGAFFTGCVVTQDTKALPTLQEPPQLAPPEETKPESP
ncbi:bactofilin family protein [Anthocerotibacter panamensis]|uniref:bactofilin family protein n=1 Tax=Anthocerotibacter panamensis TaxID=2857077 RepID=UPI001C407936|nr:polymer-forming cytoskeletal protein [Anthocerotibacter panamensis]